jgi:hypothetical protein
MSDCISIKRSTTALTRCRNCGPVRYRYISSVFVDGPLRSGRPDVDLLAPLQHSGADAIRKRVSEWFSSFQGPIGYEVRNLSITVGDDVAFCHSLTGSSGTQKDGTKIAMWWRATNGFPRSAAGGSSRTATARNRSMARAVRLCLSSSPSAHLRYINRSTCAGFSKELQYAHANMPDLVRRKLQPQSCTLRRSTE